MKVCAVKMEKPTAKHIVATPGAAVVPGARVALAPEPVQMYTETLVKTVPFHSYQNEKLN